MTKGRHQRVIQDFRQRLSARERQAEQQLEAAYRHMLRTIQPTLDKLYADIRAKLSAGEEIPLHWLYEAGRLEHIKALISGTIDHFASFSQFQVQQIQQFAAHLGQESAQQLLQATVPRGITWSFGVPSQQAIANIVGATAAGGPLSDLFNGFGREAAKGASEALIRGVTLGINPRQIARDVMQALQVPRWRALTTARTEMIRSYRMMQIENFRANDDVCSGWIWTCALSKNSCAACVAMHGTRHSLDETLDEHPAGACTMLPETKSWADILSPLGVDTSGIEENDFAIQSGTSWFGEQDEATQRAILGPGKYDAWKAGKFSLADIVGYDESEDWGRSIKEQSLRELVKV